MQAKMVGIIGKHNSCSGPMFCKNGNGFMNLWGTCVKKRMNKNEISVHISSNDSSV